MQDNHIKETYKNQDNEILKDVSKSGKCRPWKEKKIGSVAK